MRFFIALEIPEENKQQLLNIQHQIKQIIPEARLTDNDKLHLTIAFIGENTPELKEYLVGVLKNAVEGIHTFEVTPTYIDGFPNVHHPHILWAAVKGDIDKLHIVRERIKDGLAKLQLDVDERRYTPHIALAKLRNFTLKENQEKGLEKIMSQELSPIKVASLKLFESIPEEGFHKHNTLAEIPLENF